MEMAQYKQKCGVCQKNFVLSSWRNRFVVCDECNNRQMNQEIKDPEMKRMFDIPKEFYEKNSFLRNIKINYLKFGSLTEKQIETFKKVVDDIKKELADKNSEKETAKEE